MKKEFKRIKKVSKEIIGPSHFKKIKNIKDPHDRTESLKYLVDSLLKLRLLDVESRIEGVEKKEALILESKLQILKSKIKIFKSTFLKRDYEAIKHVLSQIERELGNV